MPSPSLLPILALLAAVLLWGLSYPAMKSVVAVLDPQAVMWARMAVALLALLPRRHAPTPLLRVDDPDWTAGGAACIGRWDIFTEAAGGRNADIEARRQAVAICHGCPMLRECREWAAEARPTAGVVAGVDTANPWSA